MNVAFVVMIVAALMMTLSSGVFFTFCKFGPTVSSELPVFLDALGAIANLSRLTMAGRRVRGADSVARARFDDALARNVPLLFVRAGGRFLGPQVAVAGATPILPLRR